MSSADIYFEQIKSILKNRGLTYRDVGKHLGLSEASVKRIFSHKNLDFDRLLKLCDLLDVTLEDVLRMASGREVQSRLSLEQEKLLVRDSKLFVIFLLLQRRWSVREILANYRFSSSDMTRHLLALDKNGLIVLKPGDRVKMKFDESLQWLEGGPIAQMYERQVKSEFLSHQFNQRTDRLNLTLREVSSTTYGLILRRFDRFVTDVDMIAKADVGVKKSETKSVALFMGVRPWILSVVESFKRG